MQNSEEIPLKERLEGIAVFLPKLQQPGEESITKVLNSFEDAAYQYGWVRGSIDWPRWSQTSEAIQLRDDPLALAQATEEQLACLLTTVIRQERFCEGSIESAYDSELLTGIVKRASTLLQEVA